MKGSKGEGLVKESRRTGRHFVLAAFAPDNVFTFGVDEEIA